MKKLLYIFTFSQVLFLLIAGGQFIAYPTQGAGFNVAEVLETMGPGSYNVTTNQQTSFVDQSISGNGTHNPGIILNILSEVDSEEEIHSLGRKCARGNKHIISLFAAEKAAASVIEAEIIEPVHKNLIHTISQRWYIVLSVFRL